eukprot:jgi/Astpho2/9423/Aster-01684
MAAAGGFASWAKSVWLHPAGPYRGGSLFWAPTVKWGISLANIADFSKPTEQISYPQQLAVLATGLIWSRFATQIIPVNYNLLAVNATMACTGIYQIQRKVANEGLPGSSHEDKPAMHT